MCMWVTSTPCLNKKHLIAGEYIEGVVLIFMNYRDFFVLNIQV